MRVNRTAACNFNGKVMPVAMTRIELEPVVLRRSFFGLSKAVQSSPVYLMQCRRNDCFPKCIAESLLFRPAENNSGLGVPLHDATFEIKANESIRSSLDDQLRPRFTLCETPDRIEHNFLLLVIGLMPSSFESCRRAGLRP